MPLNKVKLQNDLFNVFDTMNSIYRNGDEYMATECSRVIHEYILGGDVSTIDAGTGTPTSSVYSGKGDGTMNINSANLKNLLYNTFIAQYDITALAKGIADDINSVCSESNIIQTTTKGTSTFSYPPYSSVDGGVGKGSFTSQKSIIQLKLQSCFATMNHMTKNGNMYLAQEIASAIDNYLKSGRVSVTLQTPLNGKGEGTIS